MITKRFAASLVLATIGVAGCIESSGYSESQADPFAADGGDEEKIGEAEDALVTEVCDGIDNDGDGFIDEGNVCACTSKTNGGHQYMLCDTAVDWGKAKAACRAMGLDLARIETAAESSWLATQPMGYGRWTGVNDAAVEGVYRWADGSLVSPYTNWGTYEPNGLANENCGQVLQDGKWNDLNCGWTSIFLCEQRPAELCDGADNDGDGLIDEGNVCACTTVTYNGRSYSLCDTPVDFATAREACNAKGQDLAKIDDASEAAWLASKPMGYGRWIGLTDAASEGTWRWVDGQTTAGYSSWGTYEPNGWTNENCAQLLQDGKWNDLNCGWTSIFACEDLPRIDLVAGWVTRLPRIDYVWGSQNPGVEGWPTAGQAITWRANVRNKSTIPVKAVPYRWLQNGNVIASGSVDIPANGTATIDLPWTWTFTRHTLKLVLDPMDVFFESEEGNNSVEFATNAISVGLWVEQSVYNYFDQYQHDLGVGSNSWEDWAQRHVTMWNKMFADSVYPESPSGVLDRIRLDKITVVPDGALPLAGGLPTNNPDLNDRSVDLQWGFPATSVAPGSTFYADHSTVSTSNPFYYEASLLHELGHARYLVDVYGFNVHHGPTTGSSVAIQENGAPVAGSAWMPLVSSDAVYYAKYTGLMNGNLPLVDRHSVGALNRIAGHRATLGNYNAPGNIGKYLRDIPAQNTLTVKNAAGTVLGGASVKIYRAAQGSGWYAKVYDNTPDLTLTADASGRASLGACPFEATCNIQHTYNWANTVVIVRVAHGGKVGYGFLELTDFNLEYWRGNTAQGNYELRVNML